MSLIAISGGSKTVIGKTLKECKENSKLFTNAFPKNYIAYTLPYAIYKKNGIYDVSIPFEIKKELSIELRLLLSESL